MTQALVLIEQGQLCSGVRAFSAHDDAGAGRIAGQVDHAGELGDLGAVTQGSVLVQGGVPESVGYGSDSTADRLGDRVSDREPQVEAVLTQSPDVGEEDFRGSGAVGADKPSPHCRPAWPGENLRAA
ncbi:hypothetical protein OHA79_49135 (plasmid) [Streptomyces sp. NBC_00841]|uniref:hypothetical protein n=1 Tax=Streptomyces sp. NBC_01669 TaxID=2975909 RepID=UPI00225C268A|nr:MULTISPECIES: hypothetical protein [unclassified Streptomyces]MCX4538715.1 hypothetical protein [Streptomyces sp. NBC_01669]WSA05953.1 hypothetical protein OHA79_49135 [Streptomyces sp. NBC_00841]